MQAILIRTRTGAVTVLSLCLMLCEPAGAPESVCTRAVFVYQGLGSGSFATVVMASKDALSRIKNVVEYLDANDGLCKGEAIREWIEAKIEAKLHIKHCTFYELQHLDTRHRDLAMVGMNLSTGQVWDAHFFKNHALTRGMVESWIEEPMQNMLSVCVCHRPAWEPSKVVRAILSHFGVSLGCLLGLFWAPGGAAARRANTLPP